MSMISTLLYPVPPASYNYHSFPGELLWIPLGVDYSTCQTGDCIPAIFLQCPAARYLVIYFHSNGEDVGLCYSFGCGLRMVLEVHVLLVEYPGYGICPGSCSEESFWRAAVAAYRFVSEVLNWPAEDIIVMGRSLGAAIATRVAGSFKCHGLILVAPFLSLVDAVSQYVGGLAKILVNNIFCNADHIRGVRVPTLIIHGQKDRLVPCQQGVRLYDLCPHPKKLLVCPEEMGHNSDLLSNADFLIRPMLRFFSLPDYAFVDLKVPAEAFNKKLCPYYHNIVEMVKDGSPLNQHQGDQEPCPTCSSAEGPQWLEEVFPAAGGDLDDLAACGEHTVRTPRERSHLPPFLSSVGSSGVAEIRRVGLSDGARSVAAGSADSGYLERPGRHLGPAIPEEPSEGLARRAPVNQTSAERLPASSGAAEDHMHLPGLSILDIDGGISRFLHEAPSPVAGV
eukprot:TRINITY_DN40461_c0_g1_i1.p1 TRINITY_DN40461_c0_g1~~TRINITY_DN40461_c0_g1_i1.p1  ORF type:complete len:451 (-),score=63.11 TRINITY_DN40461_c0_g1_i1:91-1443(-)